MVMMVEVVRMVLMVNDGSELMTQLMKTIVMMMLMTEVVMRTKVVMVVVRRNMCG
jgi:hypothetical protein